MSLRWWSLPFLPTDAVFILTNLFSVGFARLSLSIGFCLLIHCPRLFDYFFRLHTQPLTRRRPLISSWFEFLLLSVTFTGVGCRSTVPCAQNDLTATSGETLTFLHFACASFFFFVQIPPYEREIYVITMIKVKINEHCAQAEAASGGAAA